MRSYSDILKEIEADEVSKTARELRHLHEAYGQILKLLKTPEDERRWDTAVLAREVKSEFYAELMMRDMLPKPGAAIQESRHISTLKALQHIH